MPAGLSLNPPANWVGVRAAVDVGATNNATVIQAAIDSVASAGGGVVAIPRGTYLTGPLAMKTGLNLVGEGRISTLKLVNGVNTNFITLENDQTEQTAIENLRLDGNKANQSAGNVIHYINTTYDNGQAQPSLGDPNHYMRKVIIVNAYQHGLYTGLGGLGQNVFDYVLAYDSGSSNFKIESPDNHLVSCISARAGLQGFYIASNSNRLMNCKSWGSGQVTATSGAGFFVASVSRADLTHCESQDNKQHGYSISNTSQSQFVGCKADRNGLGAAGTGGVGDGFQVNGMTDSIMSGCTAGDRNSGGLKQRWGYNCSGTNARNIIDLSIGATSTSAAGTGSFGTTSVGRVRYNGADATGAFA